jgi:GNAT superfamily N-acetyltransferase
VETKHQVRSGAYLISSERALLDLQVIHGFLSEAYWSNGVPFETVARAVERSLPIGAYRAGTQVGFARAVTDYATFAYIADVFVLEEHRGQGLGKLLIAGLTAHPDLQGLRTWMLLTRDAHGLYRQFGFAAPSHPERIMMKRDSGIYLRRAGDPASG